MPGSESDESICLSLLELLSFAPLILFTSKILQMQAQGRFAFLPPEQCVIKLSIPVLLTDFADTFGFRLWESLIGCDSSQFRRVLDNLFPPTFLPDGQVRRSFMYPRPADDIRPFLYRNDILWRSSEVWNRIFEHQNPMTCNNRTFLKIAAGLKWGFGSMMWVAAIHLGWAMDAGRILIYPESFRTSWVDDPVCGTHPNPGCFFLPLTNCTPESVADIILSPNDARGLSHVPVFVQKILKNSLIDPTAYSHYWLVHAIAYFTRVNNRTDNAVKQIVPDSDVLKTWEKIGFDVAIHIRHGDKRKEMLLIDESHYAKVLNLIRKFYEADLTVFLASDDPRSFKFLAEQKGIKLHRIRTPYPSNYDYRAGLFYLADIWTAVKATFIIGTWKSNYDRWVRALMDVAVGRASGPSLEVGKMSYFSAAHCQQLQRPCFPTF
jgi:hypothetical protein